MTGIETLKENPLFSSPIRAYELHSCGINLSDKFEMLAISEKCIQGWIK